MSALYDTCGQATYAWQRLQEEWAQTTNQWRDATAAEFARDYWRLIAEEIPDFLSTLQSLAEMVTQAKQSVQ